MNEFICPAGEVRAYAFAFAQALDRLAVPTPSSRIDFRIPTLRLQRKDSDE
jgi:hypothetical protein